MKKLSKKQRQKTIEAYACNCRTPDDCVIQCTDTTLNLQEEATKNAVNLGFSWKP